MAKERKQIASEWMSMAELVSGYLPISRSTWFKMVAEGRAPRGKRVNPRLVIYRKSDIDAWVESLETV